MVCFKRKWDLLIIAFPSNMHKVWKQKLQNYRFSFKTQLNLYWISYKTKQWLWGGSSTPNVRVLDQNAKIRQFIHNYLQHCGLRFLDYYYMINDGSSSSICLLVSSTSYMPNWSADQRFGENGVPWTVSHVNL